MSWTGWNRAALGLLVCSGPVFSGETAQAVELETAGMAIVSDADGTDDSVLIVTRKATEDEVAERINDGTTLEPISQVSEFEPELADPEPNAGAQAEVTDVEPRVASLTTSTPQAAAPSNRELALFNGAQAGVTTLDALLTQWGEPVSRSTLAEDSTAADPTASEVLRFDSEPFERVETLIEDGIVRVIRVTLAEQATVEGLVKLLDIGQLERVDITDPTTSQLLAVTIPEQGLTMLTKPTTTPGAGAVSHLVLQGHDSQAFALRAETRGPTQCKKNLADLDRAIAIDAENAHAFWLRAGVLRTTGQAEAAELSAAEAVRLLPEDTAYQLRWAQCLADLDRHDEAVLKTRAVIDTTTTDIVRAEALHTLGNLAMLGDKTITDKAIRFQTEAITLADKLATSSDDQHRRAAKDLLVRAHLAIANLIARGDYPDKTETVGEWIGRASGLAEERITNDGGGLELRLLVAREALSTTTVLHPTPDPQPWVQEAEETALTLHDEATDPLFLAKVEWDLGLVHQRATRAMHLRRNAKKALEHGLKAIVHLTAGAEPRVSLPEAERTVGALYFYLGATQAVHLKNHAEATLWYDKARPILTAEPPKSEFRIAHLGGERLVSMAVSYWAQDRRDLAVDLTTAGAQHMEQAVEAGTLKRSALTVPYGNLITMHTKLGNQAEVIRYEELYTAAGGKPKSSPVAKKSPAKTPLKTAQKPASPKRSPRGSRPTPHRTLFR